MGRKKKQAKKSETPKKQVQVMLQQSSQDSFMHEQQVENQQKSNQDKKDSIKQDLVQQNEESHVEIIAEIQNESSDESQQIQVTNKIKKKTKTKKKNMNTKNRPKRNRNIGAYPKFDERQLKLKYENIVGDANKSSSFENLIVDSILQEGFEGEYKYFLANLRNNKLVYIKQRDAMLFFPRKLLDYYLRILAKIAKSSHQIPVRN